MRKRQAKERGNAACHASVDAREISDDICSKMAAKVVRSNEYGVGYVDAVVIEASSEVDRNTNDKQSIDSKIGDLPCSCIEQLIECCL